MPSKLTIRWGIRNDSAEESLEVVRSMRAVLITRDGVIRMSAAILLPIAPLTLTIMPLEDLVKMLLGMLF